MANTNQFLPWATGAGANVLSPSAYAALAALQQGFQNGVADPAQANTALRQATFVAAGLAQLMADFGPNNVLDDGNLVEFENDLVATLKNLFEGVQFIQDQGSANAIALNPGDQATFYSIGMIYIVRIAAANIVSINQGAVTVSVSGLAPVPLVSPRTLQQLLPSDLSANGLALIAYDGAQFQLLSTPGTVPPNIVIHYGTDVSLTVNEVIAATDASVISYNTPTFFAVKIAITNTGPATLNVNGIGFVPITRGAGTPVVAGDLPAGNVMLMCYDGAEAQLLTPWMLNFGGGGGGGSGYPPDWNDVVGQLRPYWISVISATTATPPSSPSAGDAYLIPSGATGAWASLVGKVAQWTGTGWVYASYPNGSVTQTGDTLVAYTRLNSNWLARQIPSFGKLYALACL